jgi:hypothetical protein
MPWRAGFVAAAGQAGHHRGERPQGREDDLIGRSQVVDPAASASGTISGGRQGRTGSVGQQSPVVGSRRQNDFGRKRLTGKDYLPPPIHTSRAKGK